MTPELFAQAFFEASLRASCLIAVLLLLRPVLLRLVPARFVFVAWLIVALPLIVPVKIPVRWSVPAPALPAFAGEPLQLQSMPPRSPTIEGSRVERVSIAPISSAAAGARELRGVTRVSVVIWGTGVLIFSALWLRSLAQSWRLFRTSESGADVGLDGRLASVAAELGLSRVPRARVCASVRAPAIIGMLTPTILFPPDFAEKFSGAELRLMLLHELGHWRRADVAANALLQAARILHWFNPLVWVAVRLARQDCELACDEFVMRRVSSAETRAYGATLLKVLGVVRGQSQSPQVLGILENKQQLKRRIQMIADYRTAGFWRVGAGLALVASFAFVAVTREARADAGKVDVSPAVAGKITTVAPAPWFKNGSKPNDYDIGSDPTQPHVKPVSAYIKSVKPEIDGFGGMMQSFAAEDYRGKRVRFSAWVKSENVEGTANVWMRIDGKAESQRSLQFDNMNGRDVKGTTAWQKHAVVLDVPAEAESISLGFFVSGTGQAWFNDSQFEIVGSDVPSTNMKTTLAKARPKAPQNLDFAGKPAE